MLPFEVRAVREEDAAAIVDLLNPIITAGIYTIMDEPFSVQDQIDFIRGFPQRGVYHAAVEVESGRVLGIQDVAPLGGGSKVFQHVGEISTFVSLADQRGGVGRSLCEATFQRAQELGLLKILANVRGDNPRAVAFYQSQGFRVIGTAQRQAFVWGKYLDEILLERLLT